MNKFFGYIILFFFVLTQSCTQGYENFSTDIERNFSVVVDNQRWDLESNLIFLEQTVAFGDTMQLDRFKFEILDKTAPYPRRFNIYAYLNSGYKEMLVNTELSRKGMLDSMRLLEVMPQPGVYAYDFTMHPSASFQPTFEVLKLDTMRQLISGMIEGTLLEINDTSQSRTFRVSFQNIYYIKD